MAQEPTSSGLELKLQSQEEMNQILNAAVLLYGLMTSIEFSENDEPEDAELHALGLAKVHEILGPRLSAEMERLVTMKIASAAAGANRETKGEPS